MSDFNKQLREHRESVIEQVTENEIRGTMDDIRTIREKLGQFSYRDFHEGVYGEKYTKMVLGESGGEDVLMSELSANDEVRAEAGQKTTGQGHNRIPKSKLHEMSEADRFAAREELNRQEKLAGDAAEQSAGDNWSTNVDAYNAAPHASKVIDSIPKDELQEAIDSMSPEEKAGLLALAKKIKS